MEKDHRWAAEIVYLGQPISAYENMVRNKESTISYSWNSNMVLFYQEKFFEDYVLTSAWQEVVRAKRPASFSGSRPSPHEAVVARATRPPHFTFY
jgi:hypothetical protein